MGYSFVLLNFMLFLNFGNTYLSLPYNKRSQVMATYMHTTTKPSILITHLTSYTVITTYI